MIPDKIYLHEEDFARIYTQPSPIIDDGIEYIRKEAIEHIISGARGPQEALNKIRSL